MLTTTATVDSAIPTRSAGRTAAHRVVMPPSVRMRTSAPSPAASVTPASENWMPSTDSPSRMPIAR